MIAALTTGGRVLGNAGYMAAAEKSAGFILKKLIRSDGRLLARYRGGEAAIPAAIGDYTFLIWGLIELYEGTYKPSYLKQALNLNDDLYRYEKICPFISNYTTVNGRTAA